MAKIKYMCRLVNKKVLAEFIGYLQSTCLAIPTGKQHLVALYSDLNSVEGWCKHAQIRFSAKSINEILYFWTDVP